MGRSGFSMELFRSPVAAVVEFVRRPGSGPGIPHPVSNVAEFSKFLLDLSSTVEEGGFRFRS
jgi:hypothetical protein